MTEQQLKYYLSLPRFNIYLHRTQNDVEKACQLYKVNIELSEAFYPVLAILEVSLRNTIHATLKHYYQDEYWFKNQLPTEFLPLISETIQKLTLQGKTITADRIVAELNFGFWCRLFNHNYAKFLWKPLHLIFKHIPKSLRQRHHIAAALYRMRTLRNRIFHYEPIFSQLQDIEDLYREMLVFLAWIDQDLPSLLSDIDRFDQILNKAKAI